MARDMQINVGIKGFKRRTNILDVEVPEQLRHKKSTGISWFDDAMGGEGMTPSAAMLLTGGPGAGKTTFTLQLADSLTKQGHVCLFNTGEESLHQVKMVAERLKLKHGFVAGQDVLVKDVLAHADELRKAEPKKQLFILCDSLQTLDDGFYTNGATNGNTAVRAAQMLTDYAKQKYAIVLIIGQVTKDGKFAGKNTIKHMFDAHGELYIDQEKKSPTYGERLFEVNKNRFGCNGKTYVLGMGKNGVYEKGSYGGFVSKDEE